jgi:hypothetical protein
VPTTFEAVPWHAPWKMGMWSDPPQTDEGKS